MSNPPVETGAGDVTPAPRRTGLRHFDVIVSITAIFISAVSLYVAIEHGKTERDLVAANVWPFPREILSNGYDAQGAIAIGLSNGGVGPAKIRTFELFYRGRPVHSGLDLLRQCCGLGADVAAVKSQLPHGIRYSIADETVLRPGEYNPVLRVERSAMAPDVPDSLANALRDVSFRVCYCSVLDQCWISDLKSTRTLSVKECIAPQHSYDPNGR
jgi:hypothetical protein